MLRLSVGPFPQVYHAPRERSALPRARLDNSAQASTQGTACLCPSNWPYRLLPRNGSDMLRRQRGITRMLALRWRCGTDILLAREWDCATQEV